MATCIRCGRGLPAHEGSCPQCGQAVGRSTSSAYGHASTPVPAPPSPPAETGTPARAPSSRPSRAPAEANVPAGTWSGDGAPAGPSSGGPPVGAPILTVHEGGLPGRGEDPTSGPVPLTRRIERLEQRHRAADRSPLPAGALALDEDARAGELERTGTHKSPLPMSPPQGRVVPLPHSGPTPATQSDRERERDSESRPPGEPAGPPSDAARAPKAQPPNRPKDGGSGPTPTESATAAPPRPPVLASEVLREDLEPTEPGRAALRIAGALLGVLGAAATLILGGMHPGVLGGAAGLAAIAAICLVRLPYSRRAWGATVLALGGLAIASWARLERGAPPEGPVLAVGTMVLAGGLLFRARYRAARLARIAVATGMALIALWFALAGGVEGLAHLDTAWQRWAPLLLRVGFALLLLLSLLAFMGANSTGAAHVWGSCLLVWYAAHVGVQLAAGLAPAPGATGTPLPDPLAGASLAATLLVVLGAMALSQAMAALCGGTLEQRNSRVAG